MWRIFSQRQHVVKSPRECLQPRHGHIVASVPPCWESQDQGVTREGLQKGGFGVKVVKVEVVKWSAGGV